MNNVKVVVANKSNIDDIARIEDQLQSERYSKDLISTTFDDNNYINFVAIINNRVVGYLSATIVLDECSLIKVVTDVEFRRQGIAQALIDYLIEYVIHKGVCVIMLEVRCDNMPAKNLYKKSGFKLIGIRKNYYVCCDAEIYLKELDAKKD